ncbi:MAG TPA: hypothetical protein VL400_27785 [Polyangiaceae bacterium]|nr:hypothetical protein [Polyangiaceae bacterium]
MGAASYLKQKQLHRWGADWIRHMAVRRREGRDFRGTRHLLFAFCDHWEPLFGGVDDARGDARVRAWETGYPALADRFRDADGVRPQHSFFFPGEHYRGRWLETLAGLAKRGYGEVELHLHHDGDTSESLACDVDRYVSEIASHGHLSRDADGRARFAFIHGNWCISNSRPDGKYCGVDDEVELLHRHGCYADFTFPAPESDAQPRAVNQIFWPSGDLRRRRAYEDGERARVGDKKTDRMLFVSGPSSLFLERSKNPFRIEASALTSNFPATPARVALWGDLGISVLGRPEWVFVKMHTHGAPEPEAKSLLGDGGVRLHEELARRYNDGTDWKLHYVTAREMFNVALAAMDGKSGDPAAYRDYTLAPPPVRG